MLDDEKCLCGSGRLYSMCCKPFSGQGIENYKKEIDSKNYIKAYYVAVAMLSDYLEDVRKHTNRILKDNPVIGRFVLHKDVNALSELADRIFHCIPKGNTDIWGERFEFIKGLVDAEDWKNECEYYQLLYYELNNDKGKFSEQIEAIVKNTKVDVHTDQRMLELLRSVILPSGQLTELLKLDDILIEKTDSSLMKLKYKFDKAIQLALASDNTSAKKIADEVMEDRKKENFNHGILQGLLRYKENWLIKSNAESGEGYSDILIEIPESRTGIIIEIKYAEGAAFDLSCHKAVEQIREKHYDAILLEDGMENIIKYGIAFYKKRCKVLLV